ncbi:Transposon Tf2-11 polyprotein [Frankliniella fusca]|uniref:Transposon Tf2-11 polyprotein n=1 Tax=Frankliniella fusca TaxID=407009 RepID=A0AAE1H8N0_9NEOP|nr:Transposon Tf2-11 polyprotein [Frankliniella fusca]
MATAVEAEVSCVVSCWKAKWTYNIFQTPNLHFEKLLKLEEKQTPILKMSHQNRSTKLSNELPCDGSESIFSQASALLEVNKGGGYFRRQSASDPSHMVARLKALSTKKKNNKYVEIFAIKKAEAKTKHPHRNWDKDLSELQAALNTAVHDVTGFSPHRLVFGTELCLDGRLRELRAPSDPELPDCADRAVHLEKLASLKEIYLTVLSRLQKAYEKNARSYDLRRREVRYEEGQVVYRRNYVKSDAAAYFSKKLAPKYLGPFVIKKRVGARGYLLVGQDGKEDGPWHVHDLKLSPESTEMVFSVMLVTLTMRRDSAVMSG